MNSKDAEQYLQAWGNKCMICGAEVEHKDKHLISTVVPIEKPVEHADPTYVWYYMACTKCIDKGELI